MSVGNSVSLIHKKNVRKRTEICTKCDSKGWYRYDQNHTTICDACCKHHLGWYKVVRGQAGYIKGDNNNCCLVGCGTMERDLCTTA